MKTNGHGSGAEGLGGAVRLWPKSFSFFLSLQFHLWFDPAHKVSSIVCHPLLVVGLVLNALVSPLGELERSGQSKSRIDCFCFQPPKNLRGHHTRTNTLGCHLVFAS
jgi:hypothetical protein